MFFGRRERREFELLKEELRLIKEQLSEKSRDQEAELNQLKNQNKKLKICSMLFLGIIICLSIKDGFISVISDNWNNLEPIVFLVKDILLPVIALLLGWKK